MIHSRQDLTRTVGLLALPLLRLLSVAAIAAAMGLLGVWLLSFDSTMAWTSAGYYYIAALSVALWVSLSFLVARVDLVRTITIGLISPFVGGLFVFPIGSHIYLVAHWYITFPIGVATALLVRFVIYITGGLRWQVRVRKGLCRWCAYPVGSSAVCTECGKSGLPGRASSQQASIHPFVQPPPTVLHRSHN